MTVRKQSRSFACNGFVMVLWPDVEFGLRSLTYTFHIPELHVVILTQVISDVSLSSRDRKRDITEGMDDLEFYFIVANFFSLVEN